MYKFTEPQRMILNEADMELWRQSESYSEFLQWLNYLNQKVRGIKRFDSNISEAVKKIIQIFNDLLLLIDETPLEDSGSRYGNLAFRKWQEKFTEKSSDLISNVLPENLKEARVELVPYFKNSFGDPTRIDYGTGHEFNFFIFLFILTKIGYFIEEDCSSIVLVLFPKYLEVVRSLQRKYKLEPAGSHGVWGLDDFQFLPFVFGSSQLSNENSSSPIDILNLDLIEFYKKENLFFAGVDYIHQVKFGPFHEHSPMLYQISQVPLWSKVNNGLIKMYLDEVLHKFPVVQHILFGTLFSFKKKE